MSRKRVSIEDMTSAALECRDTKHWWTHVTDTDLVKTKTGKIVQFKRIHKCASCGAERSQTISCPSFQVITSTTRYPDGYLHDGGRVYVTDIRREHYARLGYKF